MGQPPSTTGKQPLGRPRVGQSSESVRFGRSDPRVRRNNQNEGTDESFGPTLEVATDATGQVNVKLTDPSLEAKADGAAGVRFDSTLRINPDPGVLALGVNPGSAITGIDNDETDQTAQNLKINEIILVLRAAGFILT